MAMASALGIGNEDEAAKNAAGVTPEDLTQALQHVQQKEEKQQALVRALLPYLRPDHQKRLERAVQIARLSHLAGTAWRNESHQVSDKEAAVDV